MALDLHKISDGIYIERIPATFTKQNIEIFCKIKHHFTVPRIRFRVSSYETEYSPTIYHPYIEYDQERPIYQWTLIQGILDTFVKTSNALI